MKRRELHPNVGLDAPGSDANQRNCDARFSRHPHSPVLPPEILATIFRELDLQSKGRSAQVCRAWRNASYQPYVWRGVNIHVDLEPSTRPTWFRILPVGHRGIRCSDLSDLNGSHTLLQEMSHLTMITLNMCGLVTEDGTETLVRCFRHAVSLILEDCRGLCDASLLLLARHLKRLNHLDLHNCKEVTDVGIGYLAGLNRPQVAAGDADSVPALDSLVLRGCREITDQSLLCLETGQRRLTNLDLGMCSSITNDGLHHLARLGHLRVLSLSFCERVTDDGVGELAKIVTLRKLDLSGTHVGDVGIASLSQMGSRVTDLDLKACLGLTDRCCKFLVRMEQLRLVSIFGCINIGEDGLEHLENSKVEVVTHVVKRSPNCAVWWAGGGPPRDFR